MKIIEVVPISRGISLEKLSYFTAEPVEAGSVVTVPLRKKMISGIVLEARNAEESRSEIRKADFAMKKVAHLQARQFFLPEFIEACSLAAEYFASTTGSILNSLVSRGVLLQISKIKVSIATEATVAAGSPTDTRHHEKYALQAPEEERFDNYKSLIREQFAKKLSVIICVPTVNDAEAATAKLEKGIEDYTYLLHGNIADKKLVDICNKILLEKHPVLLVTTGTFLSLPRTDIGTIILEKENSRNYKTQTRPYLDMRIFAEMLSEKINAKLVVGDLFLQTSTIYRYKNGEFQEFYPLKFRSLSTAETSMVDMRTGDPQNSANYTEHQAGRQQENKFALLSNELKNLILENQINKERLFVFAGRKGLSPTTICSDCGNIVACERCGNPVVLHGTVSDPSRNRKENETGGLVNDGRSSAPAAKNFFLCHHCGERRKADDICKNCGGWRLASLGIGTERVAEEIKRNFPEAAVFVFDREKIKTRKQAVMLMSNFYNTNGAILVGTEMTLPYLSDPNSKAIENSAIVGIDSFFSVPDFRMNEKIMGILLQIRSLTKSKFLLQTRDPEQKVFSYAMRGNLMDFYRDELELRKAFGYPPFATLIKISIEGKREVIAQEMAKLKKIFDELPEADISAPLEFDVFPSFVKSGPGKSILHALLKIPTAAALDGVVQIKNSTGEDQADNDQVVTATKARCDRWPDKDILSRLRSLPQNFTIKVDPESLL